MSISEGIVIGLLVLFGTALTVLGSMYVARVGAKSTRLSASETAELGWAQEIRGRLTVAEQKLAAVEEQGKLQQRVVTAATGYIDALLWWIKTGEHGKMPRPPELLHEHLDPNLLDVDRGGEAARLGGSTT